MRLPSSDCHISQIVQHGSWLLLLRACLWGLWARWDRSLLFFTAVFSCVKAHCLQAFLWTQNQKMLAVYSTDMSVVHSLCGCFIDRNVPLQKAWPGSYSGMVWTSHSLRKWFSLNLFQPSRPRIIRPFDFTGGTGVLNSHFWNDQHFHVHLPLWECFFKSFAH